MDISVRRLNHRLALQLPKELPLGLVFVVGVVGEVEKPVVEDVANGRIRRIAFELLEEAYTLRCLLTQSAENPTTVWKDETVRVGGHLIFDPYYANYFLVTHDVEIIFEEEEIEPLFSEDSLALVHEQQALAEALAGVKRRSQAVAQLEPAELPIWVQKIAPLEIQEELGIELGDTDKWFTDGNDGVALGGEGSASLLSAEMVSELSVAMDGDGDVELTTDMLAEYVGEDVELLGSAVGEHPTNGELSDTAVSSKSISPSFQASKSNRPSMATEDVHETDWLVILLIIIFIVMTVILIVAIGTLILG